MAAGKLASAAMPASVDLKNFIDGLYSRSAATAVLLPLREDQYSGFIEVFIPRSYHGTLKLLVDSTGYLEKLAWGGDRILGHIVSDYLLEKLPVTNIAVRDREYQYRVNNTMLHTVVAPRLGLKKFVPVDETERDARRKLGADLFEALVYKIEKTHGFDIVKEWVRDAVIPIIEEDLSSRLRNRSITNESENEQDEISEILNSLSLKQPWEKNSELPPTEGQNVPHRELSEATNYKLIPASVTPPTEATSPLPVSLSSPPKCQFRNFKGQLLEVVQRMNVSLPVTQFTKTGDAHRPFHTCALTFLDRTVYSSPCTQKKEAEQDASWRMLQLLRDSDVSS